jgi:hypothetical protein
MGHEVICGLGDLRGLSIPGTGSAERQFQKSTHRLSCTPSSHENDRSLKIVSVLKEMQWP